MLIFDAHLDLSMNALEWNRDLTYTVAEIRLREAGKNDKVDRGLGTVAFPDMRAGCIGLCVATLIARYVGPGNPLPGWSSPEIAWAQTQGQLAWYRAMEEAGQLKQIVDLPGLEAMLELWLNDPRPADAPIGYILSLEGADSILTPKHLERSYAQGLRALGPAHYGAGRYAYGTHAAKHLEESGRALLREMDRLGMILDATHLCDEAFWDALKIFQGPVWASHNNCRALVPDQRQFTDDQLRALIERGGVVGGVLDAWMLVPDWNRGKTTPQQTGVGLKHVVDNIDHVCQLAGNSHHAGIGSDLDGGYGLEQSPADLDTIADLQKIDGLLRSRGYSDDDVSNILWRNWINFLRRAWA